MAIKVLDSSTSSETFVKEMNLWKSLSHENILELYGASSATGEPPWFMVSPYLTNGSLTEYLKRLEWGARDDQVMSFSHIDILKMMLDIANGMQYLHRDRGIIHGDLKVGAFYLCAQP